MVVCMTWWPLASEKLQGSDAQLSAWCRPFAQRYAILLANGRGAYRPLDLDSMDERQSAEAVRKILQAAGLDGWQVSPTLTLHFDHRSH